MTIQEVACVQSAEDTPGGIAYYRRRDNRVKAANVRFWPKADIPSCTAHVRLTNLDINDLGKNLDAGPGSGPVIARK